MIKRINWSALDDRLRELADAGMTVRAIAKVLGLAEETALSCIVKLQLRQRKHRQECLLPNQRTMREATRAGELDARHIPALAELVPLGSLDQLPRNSYNSKGSSGFG
jgi:hypothetical protein